MTAETGSEADLIERDIRETQDEIGETIGKLEEQLRPREIARSIVSDDGTELAKEALDIIRRNPVPVALIAIGAIWLLATAQTQDGVSLVDRILGPAPKDPDMRRQRTPPMATPSPFEGSPLD